MNKPAVILLRPTIAFASVEIAGCPVLGKGAVSPAHSQNDGHLRRYLHELHPDGCMCKLCGKVFDGDSGNLREI